MEKTRTLKELYEFLLKRYEESNIYYICNVINQLYSDSELTITEHDLLLGNFKLQRPSKNLHSDFYLHPNFDRINFLSSWWCIKLTKEEKKEVISEKIRFLKRLIEINS